MTIGSRIAIQLQIFTTLILTSVLDNTVFTANDTNWFYNMTTAADHVHKEYTALETHPHTAILCPADFFISGLTYQFHLPENMKETGNSTEHLERNFGIGNNPVDLSLNDSLRIWSKTEDQADGSRSHLLMEEIGPNSRSHSFIVGMESEEIKFKVGNQTKHGPCPTLVYCIGFQACIFRFSIEFCRNDPLPGFRKVLQMRLTCSRRIYFTAHASGTTSGILSHVNPEHTLYLKYKSLIEVRGLSSMNMTALIHVKKSNRKVFETYCPSPMEAKRKGYAT